MWKDNLGIPQYDHFDREIMINNDEQLDAGVNSRFGGTQIKLARVMDL